MLCASHERSWRIEEPDCRTFDPASRQAPRSGVCDVNFKFVALCIEAHALRLSPSVQLSTLPQIQLYQNKADDDIETPITYPRPVRMGPPWHALFRSPRFQRRQQKLHSLVDYLRCSRSPMARSHLHIGATCTDCNRKQLGHVFS